MDPKPLNILIVAGEESGDLHGGNLVAVMKSLRPDIAFAGMGGRKMRQAGTDTFLGIDRMGTVGLVEIFGNIIHYVKVYRKLASEIASKKYAAAILIDYPTLNLRLAKLCKRAGCPVFYFISPQVWAWRKGRIEDIRKTVAKMFVVFPFEEPMYREAGVDVEFVGHPFLELVKPTMSRDAALAAFGLKEGAKIVGILPGSRKNEVNSLLDIMVAAAGRIKAEIPDCQFILPIADSINPDYVRDKLGSNPLSIRTVAGKSHDVMNCADFLIIASGSATLEAGMLGCPMAVIYKLNPLTYQVAKLLVKIEHFGLVNIVAGERVVPELLQDEVTPDNIAREALRVLKDPACAAATRSRLLRIRDSMGSPGVAVRVAQNILKALDPCATHEKTVC